MTTSATQIPKLAAPDAASPPDVSAIRRAGTVYAVVAYGLWGVFPAYFKWVASVPATEVLCHRIVWSVLFLAALVLPRGRRSQLVRAIRDRRTLGVLCVTTLLIAGNWYLFIWAVAHGRVMQASLGYFINPLLNVLLGYVFLRERLRSAQVAAVALAGAGVLYLTVFGRIPPVIALVLAASFGCYGLLRKVVKAEAIVGLTVETALLTPLAAAFLVYQMLTGHAAFLRDGVGMSMLLMLAGVITATPLLLFAAAARRLTLTTLGFIQYLAPTGHFLLAVLVYGEDFNHEQAVAFGFIWLALLIFSYDAYRHAKRTRVVPTPAIE